MIVDDARGIVDFISLLFLRLPSLGSLSDSTRLSVKFCFRSFKAPLFGNYVAFLYSNFGSFVLDMFKLALSSFLRVMS